MATEPFHLYKTHSNYAMRAIMCMRSLYTHVHTVQVTLNLNAPRV